MFIVNISPRNFLNNEKHCSMLLLLSMKHECEHSACNFRIRIYPYVSMIIHTGVYSLKYTWANVCTFIPMCMAISFVFFNGITYLLMDINSRIYLIILHYNDVIMSAVASQITSLKIVYLNVYSGSDQRKHQSSASLVFVWRTGATHNILQVHCWRCLVVQVMFRALMT